MAPLVEFTTPDKFVGKREIGEQCARSASSFSSPSFTKRERKRNTLPRIFALRPRTLVRSFDIVPGILFYNFPFRFLNVSRIKILSFKRLYTPFQYDEIKIYYNLLGQNAMYRMMQNVKLITINTYIPSVGI